MNKMTLNYTQLLFIQVTVAADSDYENTQSQLEPKPTSSFTPLPPLHKASARNLLSQECVLGKYTRLSCAKVFCPPWQRCIDGQCVCKLPYQCPRIGATACGLNGRSYLSLCHTQAISCRYKKPVFSHYTYLGNCAGEKT